MVNKIILSIMLIGFIVMTPFKDDISEIVNSELTDNYEIVKSIPCSKVHMMTLLEKGDCYLIVTDSKNKKHIYTNIDDFNNNFIINNIYIKCIFNTYIIFNGEV